MKRPILFGLCIIAGTFAQGQAARLVINSAGTALGQHPFIVFNPDADLATNPGTYLVIENPATTGITQLGTVNAPIIKSEAEQNKVRWATGSSTGSFVVPFSTGTTTAGVAMPLTVQITGAGSGGADPSLVLSTYNYLGHSPAVATANHWNNVLYMPSDVTHMNDYADATPNSDMAIDRFWIIDAGEGSYAYATKPSVNLTFGFDPLEAGINGAPGNVPGLAALLVAQRFNSTLNKWYDILPMGSLSGNTVTGAVPPTTADFFRSWTLSNSTDPLPIRLVDWSGNCDGQVVKLSWTTASEQDNAYFTIERSKDTDAWTELGQVPGAGNSSSMIEYSFTDDDASGLAYYRLRQTDINGASTVSNVIAAGCGAENGTQIVNAWDDGYNLNVVVSSTMDGVYDLTLMDAQGKIMAVRPKQVINAGVTTLQVDKHSIATGIYVVQLLNSTNVMTRRVHLQ